MYRHVGMYRRQARLMAEAAALLREYHYVEAVAAAETAAEAAEAVEHYLIENADRDADTFRRCN